MKRSNLLPILLIATGAILLLNQLDWLYITRPYIFIIGSGILGGLLLRKAMLTETRNGLFGGSFFILVAILFVFVDLRYIPLDSDLIFPILLVIFGVSNIIFYAVTRKSFSYVTFGLIFILSGLPFIAAYYGTYDYWDIADAFHMYWPVLLITIGVGFLVDGALKKHWAK